MCNCRCALLQRARWALEWDELQTLKERAEYLELDKTKSFEEFRKKYNVAALKLDLQMFARKNDTYISKSKVKKLLKRTYKNMVTHMKRLNSGKIISIKNLQRVLKTRYGK
ncbi:hypothetical protein [Lachnobacterium bovis]|uniref:Uncharacterized protein n=1 Tax=Lachnobacterium bovis DSM 14045 TaxID=1122142 RepID=A0A1H3F3C2_9FIRM|nr:hypothetical protein [Lachnobacterium bovis]SDX85523.1 hypothetical protein SAMN02910414_00124 [Lachnobacterium bovis DSM 14045]